MAETVRIGESYDAAYGTLWKDGTYFPRGTRVMVVGMHVDQGFCVRFPAESDGEPLETWEDWSESDFLAEVGTVDPPDHPLSANVLTEARDVLSDADDGCHLHLQDDEE
jgi:hypothetical protein